MTTFLNRLYAAGTLLAAICMILIAVLTLMQILGRLFGVMVIDAGEIAGYAMAGSIFFALAHTLRTGGHIRVNLLLTRLRGRARQVFEFVCLAVALVLAGMFAIFSVKMTMDSYAFNDVSTGMMPVPLWIPQLTMALGSILFVIALIHELVTMLRGEQPGYIAAESSEGFSE